MAGSPADWTDDTAGWNVAANWSTGSVPDAATDVTIAQGSPQVTAATGPASAASVDVTAQLLFDDGALTVTGDLANGGFVGLDPFGTEGGSQLTVAGTLTNSGTLQIGNGALTGDDGVTAAAVDNTGLLELFGSTANGHRATLDIAAPPASAPPALSPGGLVDGRCAGGVRQRPARQHRVGRLNCSSTAPNAFVADAGATTSNSALTGLDNITGELDLTTAPASP